MKKNNFWENIKNGLKKAVTFVVDILLFIPRFLINGIKGFFSKEESESEELVEEFEDDEEDSTPIPEEEKAQESEPTSEETPPAHEPVEESTGSSVNEEPKAEESVTTESQEEKPEKEVKAESDAKQESEVETAPENGKTVVEVKVTTSSSGSDVAATSEPTSEETPPAHEPVEESTGSSVNEEPKAEESVTTESQEEKPEKEVKAESDAKQESEVETADQPKKKAPAKKSKSTKVVEADVVDDKGNVVKESVKAEEEIKEMQIFGESDKKAAVHEKAFMAYFNNASKKYSKNLWLDGSTELQKFARAYLDAIAVKEKMTVTKSQSRYGDIIEELHKASKMTDAEKNDLEIFLGRQNYMQDKNTDGRMSIAYRFITDYQCYYYRDWFYAQQQGFDPNTATA